MDVVLLHNDKAGEGEWTQRKLEHLVRRAGCRPRYFTIKEALQRPSRLDQGDFVVVAGGDGSIRKVALAMVRRRGNPPLAPLPLGTANNIARSLSLDGTPAEIAAGWKRPLRRSFDLGLVRGPWGVRHFVEGVGLGLVSRTMSILDEIDAMCGDTLKKRKHRLHRDACVATAIACEMVPIRANLRIDGRTQSNRFLLLEVLNIRRAGPALELARHADPSDGRLDVVTVSERERSRLMKILHDRLAHVRRPARLTPRRAASVRLRPAVDCEFRIDDDTVPLRAGETVKITLEPGALEFLLPG